MNQERVVKAGLLGLGTVGSGVYKLVECQKDEMAMKAGAGLKIQKILVHNMNKKRKGVDQSLLTDKWEDIINDDEIEIVIEVMGGIEPARTMILEALHAGKNVVTANKDLVATHGHELLEAAEESGVDFLFEAAVAGAIPIIRPLNHNTGLVLKAEIQTIVQSAVAHSQIQRLSCHTIGVTGCIIADPAHLIKARPLIFHSQRLIGQSQGLIGQAVFQVIKFLSVIKILRRAVACVPEILILCIPDDLHSL